jgi:hypothetical protein
MGGSGTVRSASKPRDRLIGGEALEKRLEHVGGVGAA